MTTRGTPMRIRHDGTIDGRGVVDGLARSKTRERHPRELWREKLARDLERFLRSGGEIEVLAGQGEGARR